MKKDVEKYINSTFKNIEAHLHPENGQIYKEYDGYAAALGAAIITSGLKPALAFYTDVNKDDKKGDTNLARRWRILEVIADTLKEEEGWELETGPTRLLRFVLNWKDDDREIKTKILAASIALKLALRNFKHINSPATES